MSKLKKAVLIVFTLLLGVNLYFPLAYATNEGPSYNCKWKKEFNDCVSGFMGGCRCKDVPAKDE